ncbi:AIR synthase related protein [Nesterenkonia pannonica]|uniref:AIR synthase related protein n=1 Tax=Nesterenkonia pannonica TaxID=1548602 RepID=UPI002164E750|nr:AIR synthase related protein [Nesterenkonia pannonica]
MGLSDTAQTVADAGEDAVLAALMGVVKPFNASRGHVGLELGPGNDDAAVLSPSPGSRIVMTTDTMSEGQDFRRTWWSDPVAEAMDIGSKAAAQNLSDINGMGAEPTALLISLTLPGDVSADWAEHFTRGIIRACSQPGAEQCVIAGETSAPAIRSPSPSRRWGAPRADTWPVRFAGAKARRGASRRPAHCGRKPGLRRRWTGAAGEPGH